MTKRISMQALIDFGVSFLTKRGVPDEAALEVSRVAVESEAFRQSSHGLAQFTVADRELGISIDATRIPIVKKQIGCSSAIIDGYRCLSPLSMRLARNTAMDFARQTGIGFVSIPATSWIGALSTHILPVAEAGMLVQLWAQNNTCKDSAPLGGCDPRFSTNPIAIGFPADGAQVIADFSTSTMAMGMARILIDNKQKCDTPRFLDKDGVPTNDPSVMDNDGTLMFMGGDVDGHKGYALSLFNEALTVLGGGSAHNLEAEPQQSCAMLVLNPESFCGKKYFDKEMKRFMKHVKSSRLSPGNNAIRLPGERGIKALEACRKNGIPLDESKLGLLRQIALNNGIEPIK